MVPKQITIYDFFQFLIGPDRIKIQNEAGEIIYIGYAGSYHHEDDTAVIKKFRSVPELRSKKWKEKNLQPPIEPEELPEYNFGDLEMKLYYEITI